MREMLRRAPVVEVERGDDWVQGRPIDERGDWRGGRQGQRMNGGAGEGSLRFRRRRMRRVVAVVAVGEGDIKYQIDLSRRIVGV